MRIGRTSSIIGAGLLAIFLGYCQPNSPTGSKPSTGLGSSLISKLSAGPNLSTPESALESFIDAKKNGKNPMECCGYTENRNPKNYLPRAIYVETYVTTDNTDYPKTAASDPKKIGNLNYLFYLISVRDANGGNLNSFMEKKVVDLDNGIGLIAVQLPPRSESERIKGMNQKISFLLQQEKDGKWRVVNISYNFRYLP